jgi:hypothetical protein
MYTRGYYTSLKENGYADITENKRSLLIGVLHISYPCIPTPIFKPIPKARESEYDWEYRIWGVQTSDYIAY